MPIYDYQCSQCGCKQEVMRKLSAPAVENCPQCGEESFAKQVSAPSFQLNGTGWYATDFKGKKSVSAANSGEKTAEGAAEKPAESAAPAACGTGCACH